MNVAGTRTCVDPPAGVLDDPVLVEVPVFVPGGTSGGRVVVVETVVELVPGVLVVDDVVMVELVVV